MKQTKRISAYGIITQNDRILLCRLSPIVEDYAGRWSLPGGGLDFGEDPKAAVVREVFEETGLKATVGNLLDVNATVIEFSDKHVHAVRIIYQVTVESGEIIVEKGGSTDAVAWFSREETTKLPLVSLSIRGLELWK